MPMPRFPSFSMRTRRSWRGAANGVAVDDGYYPSSDGLPMADNQAQSEGMMDCVTVLRDRHPNAYVAMNLLLYPQEGNRRKRVAPDVLLAFGLPDPGRWRSSYKVWMEGKAPDWVLEIASDGTVGKDKGKKKHVYAGMGVREYWLFDAQGTVFRADEPRLQGFRLTERAYDPLPSRVRRGVEVVRSDVLGLDLRVEDDLIRFQDPATGKGLRRHAEQATAWRDAEDRAAHEATERATAERRAAEEAAARETAERRAAEEAAARETAERRAEKLAGLVRHLGGGRP